MSLTSDSKVDFPSSRTCGRVSCHEAERGLKVFDFDQFLKLRHTASTKGSDAKMVAVVRMVNSPFLLLLDVGKVLTALELGLSAISSAVCVA
jgi:hypothetical protein